MVKPVNDKKNIDKTKVFIPGDDRAYAEWRDYKLAHHVKKVSDLVVPVADLAKPDKAEIEAIGNLCRTSNMAVYETAPEAENADRAILRASLKTFCRYFGLHSVENHRSRDDDGVVALEITDKGIRSGYIPYTDKPLSWHTDGYYNSPDFRIRAMILHCAHNATDGGYNQLLDPEIAYIRLRDENPAYIEAFMHPQAMIIPENTDKRSPYRPVSTGPVFITDEKTGALHMRFTARGRNIIWRDDADTSAARDCLKEIMDNDPLMFRHKLQPGQGLICNNVLHNRDGFSEGGNSKATRLLYRIRYKERIANT